MTEVFTMQLYGICSKCGEKAVCLWHDWEAPIICMGCYYGD